MQRGAVSRIVFSGGRLELIVPLNLAGLCRVSRYVFRRPAGRSALWLTSVPKEPEIAISQIKTPSAVGEFGFRQRADLPNQGWDVVEMTLAIRWCKRFISLLARRAFPALTEPNHDILVRYRAHNLPLTRTGRQKRDTETLDARRPF